MANTYTQILFHVVFTTKNRSPVIKGEFQRELYTYLWGIHKSLKCRLYRIGGVEDHLHILAALHSSISLSEFVKQLKIGSTTWVRKEEKMQGWPGWQDGYGALSVSWSEKDRVIEYIKSQEEHHKKVSFLDEYKRILTNAGIAFEDQYLV